MIHTLPLVNAVLNGCSTLLLIAGYIFIRRRDRVRHRASMISAAIFSVLFLISYLVYHAQVGSVHFPGEGWIRAVYLTILVTHTLLAACVPPLVVISLIRAFKADYTRHRRIVRWTLPIWLYVSFTGVVIYILLYQVYQPLIPQ